MTEPITDEDHRFDALVPRSDVRRCWTCRGIMTCRCEDVDGVAEPVLPLPDEKSESGR
jgi:hypothetical protein